MQDFEVGARKQKKSVGLDATDRGRTVVTVGVLANRTQEARLLEEMYRNLRDYCYKPFRTKSRDLDIPQDTIYEILDSHRSKIGVCIDRNPPDLRYAEAAHSAIIIDELEMAVDESIAIVDGDKNRADSLYRAADGVGKPLPPVVNCIRSELYYPHSLFSDLVAGALADDINEDNNDRVYRVLDEKVDTYVETTQGGERYAKANESIDRKSADIPEVWYEQRRAEDFQERVNCWYQGIFGSRSSDRPMSDSVNPAAQRLEAMDCTEVAEWLSG